MKKIKAFSELTDDNLLSIAKLAMEDITTWDKFEALRSGKTQEDKWTIKRLQWDTDTKLRDKPLEVVYFYPDGLGDAYCAIWELPSENKNRIDVTVVRDNNTEDISNMVAIVKLLINWGFV